MFRKHYKLITPALMLTLVLISPAPARSSDSLSEPRTAPSVWFTQIGQWHVSHKSSVPGRAFLFHNAQTDGARSGQATANVRFNFIFQDLRRYEARLALGPAPASTGLLVQDKTVTYYFLAQRKRIGDSLLICRSDKNRIVRLFAAGTNILDTMHLSLTIKADSIDFGSDKSLLSIAKPPDFPGKALVGFECPAGKVKIFAVSVEAQNSTVNDSFDNATLVNMHLDKQLRSRRKKGGGK
jgi:hypothetical protein